MLTHELLDGWLGIKLIGDYTTLSELRDMVNDVCDRSPIFERTGSEWLRALAYEARKACERKRDVLPPPEPFPEVGTRLGADMLWPVFLPQVRMLRESLGFIDHGKLHQSLMYALEHVTESALQDAFGADARKILAQLRILDLDTAENMVDRAEDFAGHPPEVRKAGLLYLFKPAWLDDKRIPNK